MSTRIRCWWSEAFAGGASIELTCRQCGQSGLNYLAQIADLSEGRPSAFFTPALRDGTDGSFSARREMALRGGSAGAIRADLAGAADLAARAARRDGATFGRAG